MKLRYFEVDAFTEKVFGGNPAGVCLLEAWLADEVLQGIAAENNLSETAFVFKTGDGVYDLRWFTPTVEVDLCGHATLAAAHVLWRQVGESATVLTFATKSGPLTVTRSEQDLLTLDFPARPITKAEMPTDAAEVFGVKPLSFGQARDSFLSLPTRQRCGGCSRILRGWRRGRRLGLL